MHSAITEYDCQGCSVKLLSSKGAYWAQITSARKETCLVGPRNCPREALGCGELEALKVRIKSQLQPTVIFALQGENLGEEFILAQNVDAAVLFKTSAVGLKMSDFFVLDKMLNNRYLTLMERLRQGKAASLDLTLIDATKQTIPVLLSAYPASFKVLSPLACGYITIRVP